MASVIHIIAAAASVFVLFVGEGTSAPADDNEDCTCPMSKYRPVCTSAGATMGECRAKCNGIVIISPGICPTQTLWGAKRNAADPTAPPNTHLSVPETDNPWNDPLSLLGSTTPATSTSRSTSTKAPTTTTTTTTTTTPSTSKTTAATDLPLTLRPLAGPRAETLPPLVGPVTAPASTSTTVVPARPSPRPTSATRATTAVARGPLSLVEQQVQAQHVTSLTGQTLIDTLHNLLAPHRR